MSNRQVLKPLKMKHFYKFFIIIPVLLLLFASSCKKNKSHKTASQQDTVAQDTLFTNPYKTTVLKFKNKTFGVPSPILVSKITKSLNIPFDPTLLNDYQNYSKYLTTFKKAVNLGVYSANLAYINIYDQSSLFGDYYQVIKKLGQDLNLTSNISEDLLNRIEKNMENKDSLMYIVSTLFRDIDIYLTNNDLQETGALIIAGGWVESLYMLTQLYQKNPSDELLIKIGEQKAPLNNLLQLLQPYYNQGNPEIDHLFESLANISSYYDAINFEYSYENPEDYPKDHFTIIHSKTKVNIDNLDLEKITKRISTLRNWIVN